MYVAVRCGTGDRKGRIRSGGSYVVNLELFYWLQLSMYYLLDKSISSIDIFNFSLNFEVLIW